MFAASVALVGPALAADKPTVILVHGAFADSTSWDGVAKTLTGDGYTVISAANPLRSLSGDAAFVSDIVKSVKGPVVLVGHSYGGEVITNAANGATNVKALVFVAAFAPDAGESGISLSGKFPGGTLGTALSPPVKLASGGQDLYIDQSKFHDQFAADVPAAKAKLMAIAQRPVTQGALEEKSGDPAWKGIPSWFVYGDADKNIPPKALAWMAERAKSKQTVVVKGGSHVVMVSHPETVTKLIEKASTAAAGQ
ncbi:alpha/beta hydrolase [Rhizobium sp. S152]|nr:alpha/beta hydrolase [Rhizobium sp. S152]MDM9628507.1 alpha/beta hydrolase [Rhizobium sp. S152]